MESKVLNIKLTETSDPRLYLQGELVRRCKNNPQYSLRAFAQFLGLESSALSKILSGKRVITVQTLQKVAAKLEIPPDTYEQLLKKIQKKKQTSKNVSTASVPDYQQLSLDAFKVISEWYHFAILEMTRIDDVQLSPKRIARSLGITINEVNVAVERLRRLEFLEITSDGQWIDRSGEITTLSAEFTSIALRKMQKQILRKAIEQMDNVEIQHRDNTAMTMAIDSDLIPEAKKRITEFRRELSTFLENGKKKDHVYNLAIALYPLTDLKTDLSQGDLK